MTRHVVVKFGNDPASIIFRQYLREVLRSKGLRVEDLLGGSDGPTGFTVTLSANEQVMLEEEKYEILAARRKEPV
jgi:hypothetical protein